MKRTKGTNETSYNDNDMIIKMALEIFRTDAFLAINKKLIQKVGIIKAAYIMNLVDKYKYFRDRGMLTEDGGFYLTYEEQTKQLGLSEHQLRTCKKEFIEAGILSTNWAIAKKVLGDGSRWKEIYNANRSIIGADPNVLKPGQQLRIA